MTSTRRPLSVRLEPGLEAALDAYCARAGITRSHAVQEGLAQYLVTRQGPTLSSLAEGVLPPISAVETEPAPRTARQLRYREYVREKRRR
jgi:hypothetical protein